MSTPNDTVIPILPAANSSPPATIPSLATSDTPNGTNTGISPPAADASPPSPTVTTSSFTSETTHATNFTIYYCPDVFSSSPSRTLPSLSPISELGTRFHPIILSESPSSSPPPEDPAPHNKHPIKYKIEIDSDTDELAASTASPTTHGPVPWSFNTPKKKESDAHRSASSGTYGNEGLMKPSQYPPAPRFHDQPFGKRRPIYYAPSTMIGSRSSWYYQPRGSRLKTLTWNSILARPRTQRAGNVRASASESAIGITGKVKKEGQSSRVVKKEQPIKFKVEGGSGGESGSGSGSRRKNEAGVKMEYGNFRVKEEGM